LLDFLKFKNNELVFLVAFAVEVSKDLQGLCLAVRCMRTDILRIYKNDAHWP
jgi:hypothetical protein